MPLGASAFTCLATCFFVTGCVGEFTVQRLDSFNPEVHISRNQLSYDQNREGQQVTVLHLPCTKVSPQGEDFCRAKQDGPMDPNMLLAHHLEVNNPPSGQPSLCLLPQKQTPAPHQVQVFSRASKGCVGNRFRTAARPWHQNQVDS